MPVLRRTPQKGTSMTTARKLLTLVAAAVLGSTVLGPPASASELPATLPVRAGTYLALGDSVPFGYREPTTLPTPNYHDAASFVGFPEYAAADLSLRVANAACPGETTTSFITGTAPSNGCEGTAANPGYRDLYPLHVQYSGSQLDFALDYLRVQQRRMRLVSLMIGANDGFLCRKTTPDRCQSELPAVLQTVTENVAVVLGAIRRDAHYLGQIVIVDYYSLDYSDPVQVAVSQALNDALIAAAAPFDVQIADGFGAFEAAAVQAGGDSCAAGLLTRLSGGGCGVHPSVAGQQLLAGALEQVVSTA